MIDNPLLRILADLRDLAARYAQAADRRDTKTFVSVFHPDATLTVRRLYASESVTEWRGHRQLRAIPGALAKYPKTYHFVGQSLYDVGDGQASGEVYCVANHLEEREGTETNEVLYIRYQDQYSPDADAQWKIATRHVLIDWTETRSTGR
jgi:hypothetical protein